MGMINETSLNDQKASQIYDRSFMNSHVDNFLSGETVKTDKILIMYNLNFICGELR